MGWHTLKHTKSGDKKCKEEKALESKMIKSTIDTEEIQTLLARALYDNLADAPDELSFRKGDIVTVIERDVDGLMGWWLCLLHGKTGIAPGNRLKVIPPTEVIGRPKEVPKSVEVSTTPSTSDAHDPSSHYDYLPTRGKSGEQVPITPMSLKEMFDIPFKKATPSQEIYDTPKSESNVVRDEIYDVPKSEGRIVQEEIYDVPKSNGPVVQREIYDVPKTENRNIIQDEVYDIPKANHDRNNNMTTTYPQETYDVPKFDKQEIYDVPKGYAIPQNNRPANNNNNAAIDITAQLEGLELYDSPVKYSNNSSSNEPQIQRFSLSTHKTDINSNVIKTAPAGMDIYDVPSKNGAVLKPDDIYDVPTNNHMKNQQVFFGYDSPKSTPQAHDETDFPAAQKMPPKAESKLDIDKLMGEIYDSPFSVEPAISTIKRSPSNSKSTTPRNSITVNPNMNQSKEQLPGHEIYDVPSLPRGLSEEIYDVPVKRLSNEHPTNTPKHTNTPNYLTSQVSTQEIYDIPKPSDKVVFEEVYDIPTSKFSRGNAANNEQEIPKFQSPKPNSIGRSNLLQDIYDTPKSVRTANNNNMNNRNVNTNNKNKNNNNFVQQGEIYDTPPARTTAPVTQEIYDTPPSRVVVDETYDVPTSTSILADRDELYDVPPNNSAKQGKIKDLREAFNSLNETQEELYDSPANHNLNKVMSAARSGLGAPEDDYVDYHDVWSKEPPTDLFVDTGKRTAESAVTRPEVSPIRIGPKRSVSEMIKRSLSSPTHAGRPLSGDEQKRPSILDQINFDLVKELDITTTEALEQLRKLHLAVDTCVQTLLSFWSDTWLDVRVLKQTIRSLRDFSGKLKVALRLLTEFGLSTLINCTKVPRGEALMDKLIIEVEPLLESYYKIKICLLHLDSNDWKVPETRTTQNEKFFATLNAIMILSDRIPELCKAFNLGVQNKVHELFNADPGAKKTLTPLMSFQPTPMPTTGMTEAEIDNATLRRQTADRRQKARDSTITRPIPHIPPKPSLPNPEDRRSLSGSMEPPESPRAYNNNNRPFNNVPERLVTDYHPEDRRQKKYASDPATPSCADKQKAMWGGSCPILMDRHSSVLSTPHAGESLSSSSSVSASIPEETIEIKQTNPNERMSKNFPSDSNIGGPPLSPLLHSRSASLPLDDRVKNAFAQDERSPQSPALPPLDHRDIESLEFFCRQVESQVVLLRESMKNLTEAVENQEEPVVFVQYAKFISLTGHRVFHCGQDISERLINTDIKAKLKDDTAHLTVCIRAVVAATKTAALEFPNADYMMEMISSVLALGDAVRIIYSVCRKALDS